MRAIWQPQLKFLLIVAKVLASGTASSSPRPRNRMNDRRSRSASKPRPVS